MQLHSTRRVGCCLSRLRIASHEVERRVHEILKSGFSLDLTNSWRTVNASGGVVGSPLHIRRWKEYFLEEESDISALENWSLLLSQRKHTPDFFFSPSGYASRIMAHPNSTKLAIWWQPETNSQPMYMSANMGYDRWIVNMYGFKKTTNALVYIHVIEH